MGRRKWLRFDHKSRSAVAAESDRERYSRVVRRDDELLEAWRGGDQRAGRELFARHYAALDRFFHNKVGALAPDLVQKTFLGALETLERGRYQEQNNFRAWLFGIAYRTLCKHFRTRDRLDFDASTLSVHDLDPTPSTVMSRSEEGRLLLAALRQIPLDHQVVLELHYWEEMSDAAIAGALGIPLGTIKSRLRRARQLLAQRLADLSDSPRKLESTLTKIDDWARRLREHALGHATPPAGAG